MEQQYGDFDIFPKELRFLIFRRLDSCSLGRLLQLNKAYSKVVDNLGIWKYLCLSQWELSAERAKLLTQALSNKIDWKREYRILEEYSKRVYNNQIIIRSADSDLAKQIDEDPNSLHYHAFTDANMDAKAISAQGKFKLYPLPQVNFCVAYYEVRVENFGPDEPIVGIGLALDKYLRAMPGWGKDSYGLHSDDGCFFSQRSFGMQFCEPWHQGDTFGLGINYATKELFVTKNGVLLGTMASKVRNLAHMYPTVGVKRVDNKCRVNFGQRPFEFDIVHYLQELDKTDTIKSKWPFKIYSEIIQEFETQLLDSEDPKEVEAELIAATNYYEKPEPVAVVEHSEDDLDNREELFNWLLSKYEVLQLESIMKAVEANRPEMKKVLMTLVGSLELNIDENQPLTNILNLVKDRLLVVLASNFVDFISEKRTKRRAEEAKNPDLKKNRSLLELNRNYEENLLLLLCDREFPDDHMLIRAVVFSYTHIHSLEMPQVITPQDRADVCLIMAFQQYTIERATKAAQERVERQKSYQKQHQVNGSFTETYGPSPFFDAKEIAPENGSAAESNKPVVKYSEEDKFAAQRYAMLLSFGSTLFGEDIDGNSLQGALLLLWWYLAAEEPYDPKTSLNSFKDLCVEKIHKENDYWEGSQENWEQVLRGSYGTMIDHKEDIIVTTMTRAWGEFIDIMKQNSPDMEGKDPVDILRLGLIQVLANPSKAYETIKKLKDERQRTKQEQDKKSKKKTTKLTEHKSWKSMLVAVASFTVSVGLVAGIAFFFRKKWNK